METTTHGRGARSSSRCSRADPQGLSVEGGVLGLVGVRGRATGTAYFIPARVGVWLVGGASRGPLGDSGLSRRAAPPLAMGARCFSRYVSGDGAYTDVFS